MWAGALLLLMAMVGGVWASPHRLRWLQGVPADAIPSNVSRDDACDTFGALALGGVDPLSADCQTLLNAYSYNRDACFNTCFNAYYNMLRASRDLACGNYQPQFVEVALVSLDLACLAPDPEDAAPLLTCLEIYAAEPFVAAWECTTVVRLGCCYPVILRYAELLYSEDVRDKIHSAASSKDQNNCNPASNECGDFIGAGVATTVSWVTQCLLMVVAAVVLITTVP